MVALGLRAGAVEIGFGRIASLVTEAAGWRSDTADYEPYARDTLWTVLWSIRLPRVLLGLLVGCGLAAAGAGMQGLFRNPLADPSLIGVSAGAAMGAVLAIVWNASSAGWAIGWLGGYRLPVFSMLGAIAVTFIVYRLATAEGRTVVATLLLTGIAVNALASAFVGYMIFLSDARELRDFTFWSLGSLGLATWKSLAAVAPFIIFPVAGLLWQSRALNALLLGEAEARHLGIDVQRMTAAIVFLSAAMVGTSVAFCGMIGFVGLLVPHLVRLSIGPDHRYLVPASAILGGALLVAADVAARTVFSPEELPIGIVTAVVGAPCFLGLLHFSRSKAHG
jgi:iron complex transport system permease protein